MKRPGAAIVSVVALALSIGATTATWSLLSAVLLHPLPVSDPDRLVAVGAAPAPGARTTTVSTAFIYPVVPAIRDSGVFRDVTFGGSQSAQVTVHGETLTRSIYFVTANFFATIGVPVERGRDLTAADDQRGVAPVAIVADRFWRSTLGSDPGVVGQTLDIEHRPVQIVGVAARGFPGMSLTSPPDLYLPLHTAAVAAGPMSNLFAEPGTGTSPSAWISVFGRLRPEDGPEAVASRLSAAAPQFNGRPATLVPVELNALPETSRAPMKQFARLLAITIGLLLLVGCLTVGMLLLLRTEARQDEFAMCLALGASRVRLARGIVLEGAVLSAAGAALALPAAVLCFGALSTLRLPGGVSVAALDLTLNRSVLAAVVLSAAAATLVISLVSGVFGMRASVANVQRTRAGSTPRLTRRRTRAVLVAAQVAATLVLVTGAGLFSRSLSSALRVNPGFDTTRLVTGTLSLWQYRFATPQAAPFFATLRDRLNANPAIASASLFTNAASMGGNLIVDGIERHFPSAVAETGVDERYFSTIGLPILRGRDFTAQDDDRAPLVTIVSESFGRMLATGGNPVGMRIRAFHGKAGQPLPLVEVIGVVPDVITDVTRLEPLVMYVSLPQQLPHWRRDLVLRPSGTIAEASRELLAMLKGIDPSLEPAPIASPLMTLDQKIQSQMTPQQFGVVVLGALGGIALLLTTLGMYVLAESMATIRTREMGVRAALGASGRQLGGIILAETGRLVGVGLAVGLVLAWMEAGTVRAFLFRVQPLDPLTLAVVAGTILTLTAAVTLRPAITAARVDLARVLRDE